MDRDLPDESYAADSESGNINLTPRTSGNREAMPEPEIILEVLKRLHLDIECSSEKLLNLDLCITDMSLGDNDLGVFSMGNDSLSDKQSEKTLALDLSLSYLGSEVIELGCFLDSLQVEVVTVYEKLSLFGSEQELAMLFEEKLRSLEASLKPLQEKLLKMKKQLGTLQRIRSTFGKKSSYMSAEENSDVFKSKTTDQQTLVMRMPDKSISSEIDLQKKLAEFKQNEDELKSKLLVADQTVSCIEAASELTWLRLLEAENLAEVFKGIAREMISHLQLLQFSLNGSIQQEGELKSQLQACHEQLQEVNDKYNTGTWLSEMNALKEKVKLPEENLRQANDSKEASDKTLVEMENYIHSIRESVFVAQSKAEEAEAKVAELTETNMELTEELGFLKGTESNTEKISSLEKQVRDLEKQLQHAKASSEASLEQQNMLYTAIWDMETLIEDLKSKVSKAEARSENTEDRCLKLAESNSELNKEISYLKSRAENLEASFKDVNRTKCARAKDINSGAKIITDMVMQLAIERERIQKQLYSLARENMILMEELRRSRKKESETMNGKKEDNDIDKEAYSSVNGFPTSVSESVEPPETSCTSNQVNESLEATTSNENEEGSSTAPDDTVNDPSWHETASKQKRWNISRRYIFMAILVPVFLAGAMLVISKEEKFAALRHYLGL